MALVLADRVLETTTTAGSGTITLAGAKPGYQSFSAIGDGNTTYYTIALQSGTEWEVGIGTYTASGTTLSRDTVLSSSAGGAKVTFSAGTKDVFCDYPAGRAVYGNAAGVVVVSDLNATSATITTVTGTTSKFTNTGDQTTTQFQGASANITTVTGTTISATNMGAQATTQLQAASANITTVTGTTISATNMGAQATTQLQAASANITTVTGTTISATNMGAQATTQLQAASANITTVTGTTISATNMGAQASTQFQGASANITTITGTTIGTTASTQLRGASADITTLTGTTFGTTGTTQLRGASGSITTLTGTTSTFTTASDGVGNLRNIPQIAKTAAYTLATTDLGQYISTQSGTITVPNNTFAAGNAISIYNDSANTISLTLSTTTAYAVGTNTNRTGLALATRGVATVLFINPSYCIVSGNVT